MPINMHAYLKPSDLCDFDRSPEIERKARALMQGCNNRQRKFEEVLAFVKELPYTLEDWDIKASDTLKKGTGMCSSKTNLMIAMLRSIHIPCRYRIYRIKADATLWKWMCELNPEASRLKTLGEERDHVDCEIWLGKWLDCDAGRDTALERGILKLGGTIAREKIADAAGKVHYVKLADFDEWAQERQRRRSLRSDREAVLSAVNQGFARLRELGRTP